MPNNLRQHESRIFFIVEQVLALTSSTNLVREVTELVSKFQKNCITMFYVTDNSHLDRQIHVIVKFQSVLTEITFKQLVHS